MPTGLTYAVTGANGFIASHLVKHLVARSARSMGSRRHIVGTICWRLRSHLHLRRRRDFVMLETLVLWCLRTAPTFAAAAAAREGRILWPVQLDIMRSFTALADRHLEQPVVPRRRSSSRSTLRADDYAAARSAFVAVQRWTGAPSYLRASHAAWAPGCLCPPTTSSPFLVVSWSSGSRRARPSSLGSACCP